MQEPEQESEYFVDQPMNIHTEPGSMVRYAFPNNGYDGDKKKASERLVPGVLYTVLRVEIHSYVSYVELEEFPGEMFNTVLFADGSKF